MNIRVFDTCRRLFFKLWEKIRISDSEGKIRQSDRIKHVVYLPVPCI